MHVLLFYPPIVIPHFEEIKAFQNRVEEKICDINGICTDRMALDDFDPNVLINGKKKNRKQPRIDGLKGVDNYEGRGAASGSRGGGGGGGVGPAGAGGASGVEGGERGKIDSEMLESDLISGIRPLAKMDVVVKNIAEEFRGR